LEGNLPFIQTTIHISFSMFKRGKYYSGQKD
jgi:hypothetical protein